MNVSKEAGEAFLTHILDEFNRPSGTFPVLPPSNTKRFNGTIEELLPMGEAGVGIRGISPTGEAELFLTFSPTQKGYRMQEVETQMHGNSFYFYYEQMLDEIAQAFEN